MVVTKRALLALFAKAAGVASLVLSASYQIIKLQLGVAKFSEVTKTAKLLMMLLMMI